MLVETRTAMGAAAREVGFVMKIGSGRILVGIATAALVCLVAAAPDAQAQKAKSTQSEAKWIKFDPEKKEVTVKIDYVGSGDDPWGNYRSGFEAKLVVDRTDFGMEYMPDGFGTEVTIMINIEGIRK